jgi:hypothetical protein
MISSVQVRQHDVRCVRQIYDCDQVLKNSATLYSLPLPVTGYFRTFCRDRARIRCSADPSLTDRLFTVQGKIVVLINRMESMLRPGLPDQKESKRLKVLVDTLNRNLKRVFVERDQWKARQENVTFE